MRRTSVFAAIPACLVITVIGCGDDNRPTAATVVASETWSANVGNGEGIGDYTFEKLSDGAFRANGEGIFGQTHCPFNSGPGATLDSNISFTAQGTADNSVTTSTFTLSIMGAADDGQATGAYTIIFAAGWNAPEPHTWVSTRTSGSGITPD